MRGVRNESERKWDRGQLQALGWTGGLRLGSAKGVLTRCPVGDVLLQRFTLVGEGVGRHDWIGHEGLEDGALEAIGGALQKVLLFVEVLLFGPVLFAVQRLVEGTGRGQR